MSIDAYNLSGTHISTPYLYIKPANYPFIILTFVQGSWLRKMISEHLLQATEKASQLYCTIRIKILQLFPQRDILGHYFSLN